MVRTLIGIKKEKRRGGKARTSELKKLEVERLREEERGGGKGGGGGREIKLNCGGKLCIKAIIAISSEGGKAHGLAVKMRQGLKKLQTEER